MTKKTISSGIVLAAQEEAKAKQKFRGTVNNGVDIFSAKGEEITNFSVLQRKSYYKLINLNDDPISLDSLESFDPNLRATKGYYSIQYVPLASHRIGSKRCRYLIGQDLVHLSVQVSGPFHFKKLCELIPELAWIRRNSTFSDEMFGIAKRHPGIPFPFTIDYVRYGNKILEKAKEKGIDINGKPFVTYVYNKDVYEKYKDIKFARVPDKTDYFEQLEQADSESKQAGETCEE